MILILELRVLKLLIQVNVYDPRSFKRSSSSSHKSLKNPGLKGDWHLDLSDAGAVLHQLIYQANWKVVVMWVDDKPVDD